MLSFHARWRRSDCGEALQRHNGKQPAARQRCCGGGGGDDGAGLCRTIIAGGMARRDTWWRGTGTCGELRTLPCVRAWCGAALHGTERCGTAVGTSCTAGNGAARCGTVRDRGGSSCTVATGHHGSTTVAEPRCGHGHRLLSRGCSVVHSDDISHRRERLRRRG